MDAIKLHARLQEIIDAGMEPLLLIGRSTGEFCHSNGSKLVLFDFKKDIDIDDWQRIFQEINANYYFIY